MADRTFQPYHRLAINSTTATWIDHAACGIDDCSPGHKAGARWGLYSYPIMDADKSYAHPKFRQARMVLISEGRDDLNVG